MSNAFKIDILLTETAEISTDAAEIVSWDPANRRQKTLFGLGK
jgi:hypothetical protein